MEQIRAGEDFDAARSRAFLRAVRNALTGRARRLVALGTVLDPAGAEGRSFGDVQEIPVDQIVGSAASPAKAGDFLPGFLPGHAAAARPLDALVHRDGRRYSLEMCSKPSTTISVDETA